MLLLFVLSVFSPLFFYLYLLLLDVIILEHFLLFLFLYSSLSLSSPPSLYLSPLTLSVYRIFCCFSSSISPSPSSIYLSCLSLSPFPPFSNLIPLRSSLFIPPPLFSLSLSHPPTKPHCPLFFSPAFSSPAPLTPHHTHTHTSHPFTAHWIPIAI